jgi:type I restriction enzyme M protein
MIDDIKKTLWATADKLRANMDAAEYKHLVLGLIFVKYVSDTFSARRAELERRFADKADDYFIPDADAKALAAELEDRDYYKEVNVFWVPGTARWEALRAAAKQPDIGKRIDDALAVIEVENPKLKGILDKRYARAQLPDGKLGELVDLVATIGFGDDPGQARDVLGQVYEYFLGQFASAEGKRGGQFYTTACIVKTLVAVLSPHTGKVYDPCFGSGGMFVQSERFIEAHGGKPGDVSIYGQESNPTTWRLAAMNLAIRGIDFNFGREPADTFTRNQHPDLRADFILAKACGPSCGCWSNVFFASTSIHRINRRRRWNWCYSRRRRWVRRGFRFTAFGTDYSRYLASTSPMNSATGTFSACASLKIVFTLALLRPSSSSET